MLRRVASSFLCSLLVLCLSSCMVMRTDEKGYEPVRSVQNGTAYQAELLAEGQGPGLAVSAMVIGGGATSLFGPYRLQITAIGRQGIHQTFEIRKLRFRFANGQSFEFGPEFIKGQAIFLGGEYRDEVVAVLKARQVFSANPKAEGTLTLEVDAVVRTVNGPQKGTLRFVFTPAESVKWQSVNVPWEIKKSIWKEKREHPITAWATGSPPAP